MHIDLKTIVWWSNMKKDVVKYIAKCEVYQTVKTEHQQSNVMLQSYHGKSEKLY